MILKERHDISAEIATMRDVVRHGDGSHASEALDRITRLQVRDRVARAIAERLRHAHSGDPCVMVINDFAIGSGMTQIAVDALVVDGRNKRAWVLIVHDQEYDADRVTAYVARWLQTHGAEMSVRHVSVVESSPDGRALLAGAFATVDTLIAVMDRMDVRSTKGHMTVQMVQRLCFDFVDAHPSPYWGAKPSRRRRAILDTGRRRGEKTTSHKRAIFIGLVWFIGAAFYYAR